MIGLRLNYWIAFFFFFLMIKIIFNNTYQIEM